MAKQLSMKQQMYQQLANSQVQQVIKEQRDQDFKMAQDLIAQYQPTDDDMALAQSLISQYKQPAPVKQATVNEVKAESTPRQQIPSLEDFFTPTTASGKNINKESAKYIQRKEKERELAAKNSKEAIAQKVVENKEVKPFVPETNIEDQNSVNDYRKALLGGTDTDRANKAEAVSNKKKDKKETEIQKQLSAIPESAIEQYAQSKGISIEAARAEVEEGVRKANAMNTTIAHTNESKIDKETTEKAQTIAVEQKRKANQKQQTSYEAALNNAGDAITGVVNGPIRLAGMATGNDWDLVGDERRERVEQANEQRPVASGVGRTLGMIGAAAFLGGGVGGAQAGGTTAGEAFNAGYGDAMLNGATKGEAVANALNSGGRQLLSNTAKAMPVDLATDIIPTLANDIASDKSVPEVVKDTAINTLINGGFDAIGDVVSLLKPFKAVGRTVDGSIDELLDTTKNLPSSETDNLAKQIANIEAPNNLAESVSNPNKVMAESADFSPKVEKPETLKQTIKVPEGENVNPNMKVSETYSNTGKRGGGWNAEEYGKYTDPANYQYETIDELRSVEEATNMRATEGRDAFKDRVLNAERVSSIELDGLMMEWRELTEEARALEEAGEDATKLWEESNKIFRKVQEQSTYNAQALQSLAKWSRNTPEGMLINAENIVNGKTKVAQTDLQKFIEKHFNKKKGNIEFSPEFEKEFLKTAESLRGLSGDQLDERAAKEAMAKLGKMVNEQLPVKLNEKLQSFLMDNMLGNFRTLITRNAGGNVGLNAVEQTLQRPLAAGIDSLLSLKTGKRTQAGLSRAGIAEYLQGFGKGLKDEATDLATGLHTARSGENTLENAIRANRHVFKTKVADGLDGLVKHGLSVGDRPFYEAVYKQTLGDYNRLYSKGLMGDQVQALSDTDFKLYSETAAKMNALAAVYQQDSMLSNALMGFKKDIGMLSNGIVGVDILSQFSMPFVKTPANVIERAIDYSPLGAIRNAFRTGKELKAGTFDQNRFANESARNILGTALMGGSAAYAANGGLTGSYSDNKNEKQAQKESGMQEYAWNVPDYVPGIGGKQMDISWIPVIGSNAVASAAAVDEFNKGEGSLGENLTQGVQAGGKALFDQSMFQGLQRLFGTGESYNSDEGIVGNMKNVVTAGVGQAIPSLARQTAQVTDDYQRDTAYSNKGTSFGPFDTYDINSLANNIPGFREQYLAPKVDTSGNLIKENQGRNIGMKVLEDMILPGKLTDFNMSRLAEEATRLSDATENAFIPKADRSKIDTEDHTLTNEEWVNYQQNYYKEMTKAGEQLIDMDVYKNANEETQAKLLNDTYGAIKSAINSEYTGKDVTGAAKAYKEAGGGDKGIKALLDYETAHDIMKNSGVSSSSKAGEAIQEAINKGDMEEANRLAKVEENYNRACQLAGVEEKSSGTRKAWEEGGTTGLKEYVAKQKMFEKYDLDNDSTSRAVYDHYGENGLKDLQAFKEQGIKGSTIVGIYQDAKADGNVPSIKDFATTYKKMDGYGDNNGNVSQDEFKAYLKNNNITSQDKAQELAKIYGNWSTIPVLGKNGWTFKKVK